MEKLNLTVTKEIDLDSIVKEIINNPVSHYVINKLSISNEEIKDNYEIINAYILDHQPCYICKSRKECKHNSKGLQYNLKRDDLGLLTNSIQVCPYYLDYYKKENNLYYTTFDKEKILDDSQKEFLLNNLNLFDKDFRKQIINLLKSEQNNGAFLVLKDSKLRLKLVQALANSFLDKYEVMIVKLSDYIKEIKKEFKSYVANNLLSLAFDCQILIIDGLGNESISSWSRDEILLSILDNRLQTEKPTIICSEFSLDELEKVYRLNNNDEIKAKLIISKIKEIINS